MQCRERKLKSYKTMKISVFYKLSFACLLLAGCIYAGQPGDHPLAFGSGQELHDFFQYREGDPVIVSAHRGGTEAGFPENSLESFQNILRYVPAFFEIDPRLTKDSVVVLMHDATLDRTTNATGRLADYTWDELQRVRLKDAKGNITECKIPRLEDVIVWSKGKTIINLDKKDVPMRLIADLIKKHNAESCVMLTVHTGAQARYYYDRFPDIMLSAFARTQKEYDDLAISGVPWKNMIAYVGPTIDNNNRTIVENLRRNGVKCMISLAPTHDKLADKEEREAEYRKEILLSPDIIESDIPIEVWQVLNKMGKEK